MLTGDGTLLDKDTNNWAPWEPHVEDSALAFGMIRAVAALRRGPGKDFLVYGRMLRPAQVQGVQRVRWNFNGRANDLPAVFHSAWQAPDGRMAVVLANWTAQPQTVTLTDERLQAAQLYLSGQTLESRSLPVTADGISLTLPAVSCACVVNELRR